jgi:hypothetical protein
MIKIVTQKTLQFTMRILIIRLQIVQSYLVVLDKAEPGKGKPAGSTVCKQKTSILIDWHIVVHLQSFIPMLIN